MTSEEAKKQQAQTIIELNTPLANDELLQENKYATYLSVFGGIGFLIAYFATFLLSAALFSLVVVGIFFIRRLNISANQKQREINQKMVELNVPEENVWQKIIVIANWILLIPFILGFITFFFH